METTRDVRVELLRFLSERERASGDGGESLESIVVALRLPRRTVRRVCDALEASGCLYSPDTRVLSHVANPRYRITSSGLLFLYRRRRTAA